MDRPAHEDFQTLPGMLEAVMATYASSGAFHYREGGYWRSLSHEDMAGQVRRLALGLHHLGIGPGEVVGILAPSSPHWLAIDLAVLCLGGISVPMFPNLSSDHLVHESANASIRILVVMGEAAWTLAQPHLKLYQTVITRGISAKDQATIDYHGVMELGDQVSQRDPGLFTRLRRAVKPDMVATIIHTSGSTGTPKGVVLTHGNLVSQIRGAQQCYPLDASIDRALSCLPLAHIFERMVMYDYVSRGVQVYFCDDVKNVGRLAREVKPTVITMVPRLVEKFHGRIALEIDGGGGLRRHIGRWALGLAGHQAGAESGTARRGVADLLVYRRMRAALGGSLRYLIVGGAALSPTLERFLTNIGLPVFVGYGLTEAGPVVACNRPDCSRAGTVGPLFPEVEVRFGPDGEILARGPGIMRGYHHDAQATAAAIDGEGYLHTGDLGRLDSDGFLIITGRSKELFKSSNGKYVCPVPIEQAIGAAAGWLEAVMVVAEGRPFVGCLLFTTPELLSKHVHDLGGSAGDVDAQLADKTLKAEIDAIMTQVNASLDRWEQVHAWRLIASPPTIERDELTPTLKIRRHVLSTKYHRLIESMYQDQGTPHETTAGHH